MVLQKEKKIRNEYKKLSVGMTSAVEKIKMNTLRIIERVLSRIESE